MAYARKKRVRKTKRARKGKPTRTALSRSIAGPYGAFISPRVQTRLKYNETISITSTMGAMVDYQFRLNSIYDPDLTGGGHQPLGRDQLAGLYNRYRVDKVIATVIFHKNSESACVGHALCANNTATGWSNPWTAVTEQSNTVWGVDSASTAGSRTRTKLTKVFHLNQIAGVSKQKYKMDDTYQADVSNNPSEIINLHIINVDIMAATTSSTIMEVNLIYFVEFYDPFAITQS